MEMGYVTTWGMYETERQRQVERDAQREFSPKEKYNRKLENNTPSYVHSHTHTHTHTHTHEVGVIHQH